jgi:hypothetical protein
MRIAKTGNPLGSYCHKQKDRHGAAWTISEINKLEPA